MLDSNKIIPLSSNSEEDNKLKASYNFLTNELNNLMKEKLNPLIEEKKSTKIKFQTHIKEYQNEVKFTLEKEREIEQLFSKISKIKKKRALIMNNSFNNKFYKHLLEIADNPKKEKILKNFFSILLSSKEKEEKSVKDLIEILKDKEEIKNLLYYANKIYSDLKLNNETEYLNLKNNFEKYISEIEDSEKRQYPFEDLFECLNIMFEIIECEKKIKDNNEILAKLTEKKNAKFVEIKIIELKLKEIKKNIKFIQNNIKIICSFIDKFNDKNSVNLSQEGIKELFEGIEEYKKQEKEIMKKSNQFDVITSLTFGTYYTLSEDSSVKSSRFSSKNGLNLINSQITKNNNNNNNKVEVNKNNYDSNCNSNLTTNDRNVKRKGNEKAKNSEKSNKLKQKDINAIKNNNKTFDSKHAEKIKKGKLIKIENKLTLQKHNEKPPNIIQSLTNKNKAKIEEKKVQNDNKENTKYPYNKIKEEKEITTEKKLPYKFSELHNLGSRMNQLKFREADESIEMSMPRDNMNKLDIINNDNLYNDNSVCDEMVSMNYEIAKKNDRSTTNDYINKIGVKNNLVISKELYKNKIFMRRNNNANKLQIEKSVEASTCCVSCT